MKIKVVDFNRVAEDNDSGRLVLTVTPTEGDLESLLDLNPLVDYTLMPTDEIHALVNAVDVNFDCTCCGDCDCEESCSACSCDDLEDYYEEDLPEPLFGGAFYDIDGNFIYIKQVIYNAPKTTVIWNDGTKTSSTCTEGDSFNPELGLSLAVLKKIAGSDFAVKTLHDWAPVDNKTIRMIKTLKDVRRDHKVAGDN